MFAKFLTTLTSPSGIKTAIAAAVMGVLPTAAMARDQIRVDFELNHGRPHIELRTEPACPPPAPAPVIYEERATQVWVAPVYRTVCDKQWVPAQYRTECQKVWVAPRYEVRNVVVCKHAQPVVEPHPVMVVPGHYEDQQVQVLASEGHFQELTRQELVTPGHYETRMERVPVVPTPPFPVYRR